MSIGFPKPRPRLLDKAKARRQREAALKAVRVGVRNRDDHRCRCCHAVVFAYCANPLRLAQVHHVVYRSQGGADDMKNLITVCAECHAKIHCHEIEVMGDNALSVRFKRVKVPA